MTFKIMATVGSVIMAAAANSACSSVPPNAYGASGQTAHGRVPYVATSPTVSIPGDGIVGADPDLNVRYELNRNAGFHLHPGGSN
jgi:hypothetical protein